MILAEHCDSCKLCQTRRNIVWGDGPESARVMFIGQDPGGMEDYHGTPFYWEAPAGKEFDRLLGTINLDRSLVYVTNSVKCHTPNDRGPSSEERAACRPWLLAEITAIQPKLIVTMGGPATVSLLGDCDMESVHGIPFSITIPELDFTTIVVPSFHPASGLRKAESAMNCLTDFAMARAVLSNRISPAHFTDPLAGTESYGLLKTAKEVREILGNAKVVAVDTETYGKGWTPFSVQFSTCPGTGYMILAGNAACLRVLANYLAHRDVVTVVHNASFDLAVLEKLEIFPAIPVDTMIMAYLLQTEPLGLKPLAFRYWGMKMRSYEDMIAVTSGALAERYLWKVVNRVWPDPDKIEQIKPDGTIHLKQPQNITKVVARALKDLKAEKIKQEDLWGRWHRLDPDDTGRGLVEEILGPMPEGNLSMIPLADAVVYGCRDADATIRIYPHLWSRIEAQDMTEVFYMDMDIIPMVIDMTRTGLEPDVNELRELEERFKEKMDVLYEEIRNAIGKKEINLRSHKQLQKLLFEQLRLQNLAGIRPKKGRYSTDDKTLARLVAYDPIVPKIRLWKGYNSLVTKYTATLEQHIESDGRIHAEISTTRTATGRLAARNPNIMNQPTRTEDGKAIRNCYHAGEGKVFVSNDLSQIEMRMLAHESGDPLLTRIFKNDEDLHSITASNIFQVPVDQVDEMKHRYPSKRVGFGTVYGITADGLQEQLLMIGLDRDYWTRDRCQKLIDDWFALYHDVELYMQDMVRFALRHGYVQDMFGRRRYLETIHSSSKFTRLEAARQAGNMPIQSGAAGIFKKAMANLTPIYLDFQLRGYYVRPAIPIHDDLMFEIEEDLVDIWVPLQQDIMENSIQLSVPIKSDAKVGKVWGKMEKYPHYC